jgi:carbonic anhydrase/acetyltransferase-like protein (isoleucine patch superfamily)
VQPSPWISPDARILTYQGIRPVLGTSVFVAPGAIVIGDVTLGDESSIWFNATVRGDVHAIRIGKRSNLQDLCAFHVTGGTHPLEIGDRVTIGHGAVVHGCTIGDGALIGMGSRVLDGARVGEGALIAAGAVVAPGMVVPPHCLAVGTPARVRRELDASERAEVAESSDLYVEYAANHARELGLIAT